MLETFFLVYKEFQQQNIQGYNSRLMKKHGDLPTHIAERVSENIKLILDLE